MTRYDLLSDVEISPLVQNGIIPTAIHTHYERTREFKRLRAEKMKCMEAYERVAEKFRCKESSVRYSVRAMLEKVAD